MQRYHITNRQSNLLAEKSELSVRNAFRLWYFLKTHGHQSSLYIKELRPELLKFFHYKQIKKYLAILVEKGWMGLDSHGKYFLRGRSLVFSTFGARSRMSGFVVSPEVTESHDAWICFLAGCQVTDCLRRVGRSNRSKIAVASTSTSEGNADVNELPLSIENMTSMIKVSRSTASRIRQRAARRGHITNRVVLVDVTEELGVRSRNHLMRIRGKIVDIGVPYHDRYAVRFDSLLTEKLNIDSFWLTDPLFKINADSLIWKNGKAWQQRPNMVQTFIRTIRLSNG